MDFVNIPLHSNMPTTLNLRLPNNDAEKLVQQIQDQMNKEEPIKCETIKQASPKKEKSIKVVFCECGAMIQAKRISTHRRSTIHQEKLSERQKKLEDNIEKILSLVSKQEDKTN